MSVGSTLGLSSVASVWPTLGVSTLGVSRLGVSCLGVSRLGVSRLGVPRLGVPSLGVPCVGVASCVRGTGTTRPLPVRDPLGGASISGVRRPRSSSSVGGGGRPGAVLCTVGPWRGVGPHWKALEITDR